MSLPRRTALVLLLLSACTAWETSTPNYTAPPVEAPVPSHSIPPSNYIPPPPVGTPPPQSEPGDQIRVAIASVQLFDNCPDPPDPDANASAESAAERKPAAPGFAAQCSQSTVQLAVRSDRSGPFRVEAVRVLDGAHQRVAGSSTLRKPTMWHAGSGAYAPWDAQVIAGTDLQISYKLGDLDLAQAAKLVGPEFNTYTGPFQLELDVSLGGKRQTIRSAAFSRQMLDMVET